MARDVLEADIFEIFHLPKTGHIKFRRKVLRHILAHECNIVSTCEMDNVRNKDYQLSQR